MIEIIAKSKDVTKRIRVAIVDDDDADLARLRWWAWETGQIYSESGKSSVRFRRCTGAKKTELLHRVIWKRTHPGQKVPKRLTFADGNFYNCRRFNIIPQEYHVEIKTEKPRPIPARLSDDATLMDHHPCGRYAGLKSVSYKVCAKRANPEGLAGSLHILYPECVECPIGIAAREKWGPQREEYKSPPRLEMCR